MTPEREEQLLDLAGNLAERLRAVDVPLIKGGIAALGIPQSCLSTVTSYAARTRDARLLREYVELLPQLDATEAQNQKSPKASYRVLAAELARAIEQQPELDANDWLYVLAWVRRLLPHEQPTADSSRQASPENSHGQAQRPAPKQAPQRPVSGGLGTLADAFKRAQNAPGKAGGKLQ